MKDGKHFVILKTTLQRNTHMNTYAIRPQTLPRRLELADKIIQQDSSSNFSFQYPAGCNLIVWVCFLSDTDFKRGHQIGINTVCLSVSYTQRRKGQKKNARRHHGNRHTGYTHIIHVTTKTTTTGADTCVLHMQTHTYSMWSATCTRT